MPRYTPPASLGSGDDLRVMLTNRGASRLIGELKPSSGFFTRALDKTSEASLVGIIGGGPNGNECGDWSDIHAWATELLILRDGRDAWSGPVTDVVFDRGRVTVKANDLTAWYDRRRTPALVYTATDLSDIFVALHAAAMAPDPIGNFTVSATPSGVKGDREYKSTDEGYIKDEVSELAKTGVDWTAYSRTVLVGEEVGHSGASIILKDDNWVKPPSVHARGNDQATQVILKGKDGLVSVATASAEVLAFYGLLERVFDESSITDQASLDKAAQSRLALLQDPLYVETPSGAALSPEAPLSLPDLIPGMTVRVESRSTCRIVVGEFRLSGVKVDFNGSVSVDLQPLGTHE